MGLIQLAERCTGSRIVVEVEHWHLIGVILRNLDQH